MTYYLLDFAPDGTQTVITYCQEEMEDAFTADQRVMLANGERIIHHWHPRRAKNHAIADMVVTTERKWGK